MMIAYKRYKSINFMSPCIGTEIIEILLDLFAIKNVLKTFYDSAALPVNSVSFFDFQSHIT